MAPELLSLNQRRSITLVRMLTVLSLLVIGFSSSLLAIDPPPAAAPEINAAAATNALAILSGASLLLRGRRKK
jgi:hypothetical protein